MFLCVGQNVFTNQLLQQVRRLAPGVDPYMTVDVGAADIHDAVKKQYPESLDAVIKAYNNALQRVFLICLVLACLSVLAAFGMEWVSVKKEREKDVEAKKAENSAENSATDKTDARSA